MSTPTTDGCRFAGPLPPNGETVMCAGCDKLRDRFDVRRCVRNGGPRIEGLGDVVQIVTKATGIAAAAKAVFGPDCGCAERQRALNAALPFTQEPEAEEQNPQSAADTAET